MIFFIFVIGLLPVFTKGDRRCENLYEEGVTYFGEQVMLVPGIGSREECAGLCSQQDDCAYWSHLYLNKDCTLWSSDVARLENENSKLWVSGRKC